MFAYAFFSFSVSVVGLVMCVAMLAQLATGRADWRRALALSLAAAIACGTLWMGTWAGTGYNALACMLTAIHQHAVQQVTDPFVPVYMWWLRSSGNLTAYLFTIAPLPGVALALHFAGRRACRSRMGCWLLGALVGIGVASFGGLFWLETERLWIFLTPLFAGAACGAIDRLVPERTRPEARLGLLIASAAFVLTFEAVFKPYI